MRLQAAAAVLMALASIQLSTAPLLAKPTRTIARPSARRLLIAQPLPRSSRDSPSRERTAHSPVLAHSHAHAGLAQHSASASRATRGNSLSSRTRGAHVEPANNRPSGRHQNRPYTLAQERAFAAQAAIASADRGLRNDAHSPRALRINYSVETVGHHSVSRLRDSAPSNPTATGDEQAAALSSIDPSSPALDPGNALINIGGVLRPAPGSRPLKSIEDEALTPVLLPALRVSSLYDSSGRLIVPRPLYGSREILLHQNQMADRDGINRVQDDADLLDLRREKKLVALPDNETLRVDFRLPENRRYSRPWTAAFLTVLATDFYASFHTPLQVDSAVRTVAVQQRLIRTNGNAAPSTGDTASPHLTGQAVDIAKGGLSRTQIAWMRTYLQPLIDLGKIDVEEEFQQSCFHISVYRNFVPIATPPRVTVATARQLTSAALAERPTE